MGGARTHARNLMFNWGAHVAALVVMFFLSPFVVHSLGKIEYGIWSLLNVLTGYMGIFDLGIRASTGRHVILYLGKGDHEKVDRTIRTGLGFYSFAGGLILLVGIALGAFFPQAFRKVPPAYHTVVAFLLPALAVNLWITAVRTVDSSLLTAHERFDLARSVDLVMLAVRTAATVAVLWRGWGIVGLAAVTIATNVVGLLGTGFLARRVYPRLRHWPLSFDRARLRELVGFGAAAFVTAISVKIIGQTDLVIVGAALGTSAVAVYSVGAMLVYYSNGFLSQINQTLFPAVQKAAAREEKGGVRWIYLRQVRLAGAIGILMYVGMLVFARPFIDLWMFEPVKFGHDSVALAATVMMVLAGSKLLYLLTMGSGQVLTATGHVNYAAALTVIEAGANLGLSLLFVLVFGWGLAGVALGTLLGRALTRVFWMPWRAGQCIGLPFRTYLLRLVLPVAVTAACFAGVCYGFLWWLGADTWPRFALAVGGSVAAYAPLAFALLVPAGDRKRLVRRLPGFRLSPGLRVDEGA